MSTDVKQRYSLAEYLALESESEVKYEYWNGEIFAMSGGTLEHDRVMGNLFDLFRRQLENKDCLAFTNNMQIKVPAAPPYRYADGSVVCGKPEIERFNSNDLLLNPVLIFEVLSPSTEAYDRGDKFTFYKSIVTFREYLLIAQHRPHLTHYLRQGEGNWTYEEMNDLSASLYIATLDCMLKLGDVYAEVDFKRVEKL